MLHRIAMASSDGKVINQHFGHADRFHIVDIDEAGYTFIETRLNHPACDHQGHSLSAFDTTIDLLSDCDGIFVSQIGNAAASYLTCKGVRVFVTPYPIADVLRKLVTDKILDVIPENTEKENRNKE